MWHSKARSSKERCFVVVIIIKVKARNSDCKSILLKLEADVNQNLYSQWKEMLVKLLIEPQNLRGERDLSKSIFSFYKRENWDAD